MTALTARRLVLTPGELDLLRRRLDLPAPPGFAVVGGGGSTARLEQLGVTVDGAVQPAVAAGLVAACAPQVGVLVVATVGQQAMTAALGVRGELGGSLAQAGTAAVEAAVWPAPALGTELARVVPPLGRSDRPDLHLPLADLAAGTTGPAVEELRAAVVGSLRATVVTDAVLGQVVWLATAGGWLAMEPAPTRCARRWATIRPVQPEDLGPALAPYLSTALS
jgi:hypothetical protein